MPYVLDFNRSAIEIRIERLAAWLGLDRSFDAFKGWILALREEIGIPHTLAGLGVDDSRLDEIAAMAIVRSDRRRQSDRPHDGRRQGDLPRRPQGLSRHRPHPRPERRAGDRLPARKGSPSRPALETRAPAVFVLQAISLFPPRGAVY